MRKRLVSQLEAGMVLGKTVYNDRGDILLLQGVTLTTHYIESLRSLGFYAVFIRDGLADDVEPQDVLSDHLRVATYKHVKELFRVVENAASTQTRAGKHGRFANLAAANPNVNSLYHDVEKIVDEVLNAEALSGVASLKSHDSYTFEHSVEVAVAGVMLGKRLYLPIQALHQLALGCLCHDLGKQLIPAEILNKDTRLTSEEFKLIEQHPESGYQAARQLMREEDIIARHIVWQHHERQDGTGYPRRLRGANRFGDWTNGAYFGQGHILPAAEIAAVADVYSALASDRPYRPALGPAEIVSTLRRMAGTHLNREIVTRFLSILPSYPVGTEVVVIAGKLRGYRGIVAEVKPEALNQPMVRILYEPRGRRVVPFQVDTRAEKGMELAVSSYEELAWLSRVGERLTV